MFNRTDLAKATNTIFQSEFVNNRWIIKTSSGTNLVKDFTRKNGGLMDGEFFPLSLEYSDKDEANTLAQFALRSLFNNNKKLFKKWYPLIATSWSQMCFQAFFAAISESVGGITLGRITDIQGFANLTYDQQGKLILEVCLYDIRLLYKGENDDVWTESWDIPGFFVAKLELGQNGFELVNTYFSNALLPDLVLTADAHVPEPENISKKKGHEPNQESLAAWKARLINAQIEELKNLIELNPKFAPIVGSLLEGLNRALTTQQEQKTLVQLINLINLTLHFPNNKFVFESFRNAIPTMQNEDWAQAIITPLQDLNSAIGREYLQNALQKLQNGFSNNNEHPLYENVQALLKIVQQDHQTDPFILANLLSSTFILADDPSVWSNYKVPKNCPENIGKIVSEIRAKAIVADCDNKVAEFKKIAMKYQTAKPIINVVVQNIFKDCNDKETTITVLKNIISFVAAPEKRLLWNAPNKLSETLINHLYQFVGIVEEIDLEHQAQKFKSKSRNDAAFLNAIKAAKKRKNLDVRSLNTALHAAGTFHRSPTHDTLDELSEQLGLLAIRLDRLEEADLEANPIEKYEAINASQNKKEEPFLELKKVLTLTTETQYDVPLRQLKERLKNCPPHLRPVFVSLMNECEFLKEQMPDETKKLASILIHLNAILSSTQKEELQNLQVVDLHQKQDLNFAAKKLLDVTIDFLKREAKKTDLHRFSAKDLEYPSSKGLRFEDAFMLVDIFKSFGIALQDTTKTANFIRKLKNYEEQFQGKFPELFLNLKERSEELHALIELEQAEYPLPVKARDKCNEIFSLAYSKQKKLENNESTSVEKVALIRAILQLIRGNKPDPSTLSKGLQHQLKAKFGELNDELSGRAPYNRAVAVLKNALSIDLNISKLFIQPVNGLIDEFNSISEAADITPQRLQTLTSAIEQTHQIIKNPGDYTKWEAYAETAERVGNHSAQKRAAAGMLFVLGTAIILASVAAAILTFGVFTPATILGSIFGASLISASFTVAVTGTAGIATIVGSEMLLFKENKPRLGEKAMYKVAVANEQRLKEEGEGEGTKPHTGSK